MTAFDKAWDIAKGMPTVGGERMTPEEAVEVCKDGGCVWLKDYADENYGDEDNPSYDYPVEDPEDILRMIEEGAFDGPNPVVIMSEPSPSMQMENLSRDNMDILAEILGTDSDGVVDEYERLKDMFDNEPSEAAMRSARIGSGRASFDDLMADRDKAIEDGKDLRDYYDSGAMGRRKKD